MTTHCAPQQAKVVLCCALASLRMLPPVPVHACSSRRSYPVNAAVSHIRRTDMTLLLTTTHFISAWPNHDLSVASLDILPGDGGISRRPSPLG